MNTDEAHLDVTQVHCGQQYVPHPQRHSRVPTMNSVPMGRWPGTRSFGTLAGVAATTATSATMEAKMVKRMTSLVGYKVWGGRLVLI
jgi:hypothetical protein